MKKKTQVIVGMIGLVGSGKSSVAQEIAKSLDAWLVRGDEIRLKLRRQGQSFDQVEKIAVDRTRAILKRGFNIVLDSDLVTARTRQLFIKEARAAGARVCFVRTVADLDVMLGRMMNASYTRGVPRLFRFAGSSWKGKAKGAVVKVRESWRRVPHHYRWTEEGGGKWVLRKMSFPLVATIDTTDGKTWKKEVAKLVKRLV